ncbi:MAG: LptF/LptG family permease [Holophagaceae bacterium]|nr:LptF/LptG family permease [Holophagaceae bacterium]
MPKILVRYFLRRWGLQILTGFVFFGGLLLAWELKSVSKIIFEQHASISHLIPLILTTLPWNVGLILPMASVLGGLLGTQNLSEGSEFVAQQGLGCGKRGFLMPWGVLSLILMACSTVNAHWVSPWASRTERQIFHRLAQDAALTGSYMPKPGDEPKLLRGASPSNSSNGGEERDLQPSFSDSSIYLGMSKDDGKLHILQISPSIVSHLISDKYTYKIDKVIPNSDDAFESMQFSIRFENVSGKAVARESDGGGRLTDLSYQTFEVNQPIRFEKQAVYQPSAMRHLGTGDLLLVSRGANPALKGLAGVELSRRFSNPLACCALLLLGIALGLSHPRFYKGGAFVKSIGIIILYFIVVKVVEGWIESNTIDWVYISIILPFSFLLCGWLLLNKKMYPSRHRGRRKFGWAFRLFKKSNGRDSESDASTSIARIYSHPVLRFFKLNRKMTEKIVIGRWTSRKWWGYFAGVMAIFMVFHIFMEFAGLAPWVAAGGGRLWLFARYWVYNLPVTLPFILPVVFLLSWVLTFSDASISREWVAMRAGGVSLVQWIRSFWKTWGFAILAIFAMDAYMSPLAFASQDRYYKQVKTGQRDSQSSTQTENADDSPTTLFLATTGVFWHTEGSTRWGFPLLSPSEAPSLIFWEQGQSATQQLNWNESAWTEGMDAGVLFPAAPLRQYQKADEIPTMDLFTWQAWAPSAERGTMLWGRLLKWLAGPCLFFAALGFAFPPPRKGRGHALGNALIISLLFMWLQNLFEGASKAGQFPPIWGILAPMLILMGFGLINLRKLHT